MKETKKYKELVQLFLTFMQIGGFTIGGGYAMIPTIQNIAVDKKKWVSEETMTDYITLAQSVPGVVGINTATAVGYKVCGLLGAIAATLGMVTPSFVCIILIALLFEQFQQIVIVQNAFAGIRAAVVSLILIAVLRMFKTTVKGSFQLIIAISATVAIWHFKIPSQYVILMAAFVAVVYKHIKKEVE